MKKIGMIVLALVIALGTIGVGYAMWQDDIVITGNVETGNLDLVVEYVSGVEAYKDLTVPIGQAGALKLAYYVKDLNDCIVRRDGAAAYNPDQENITQYLVATCYAEKTADDEVTMYFNNIFPTVNQGGAQGLYADVICHYYGSVPAHVYWDFVSATPELLWLKAHGFIDVYCFETATELIDDEGWDCGYLNYTVEPTLREFEQVQLHYCESIKLNVYIDLPQCDDPYLANADTNPLGYTCEDFMDLDGSFTIKIHAAQWNEYPVPAP